MGTGPKTLNVEEQHALLDRLLCHEGTSKQFRRGVRNHTIAMLMLEAGLRIGEVVKLRLVNVYYMSEPVSNLILPASITKNKHERTIPISTRLRNTLKEFYKELEFNHLSYENTIMFVSSKTEQPLTTRQVERIFRSAGIASIGRPVYPHILRHTFATKLMRVTDIRTVQVLLGHSSVTSTQIYTHPNDVDKRNAIEGMNSLQSDESAVCNHNK